MEVFHDSDKVGANVVHIHGCPHSCMLNLVKGLLEVYSRGLANAGDFFYRGFFSVVLPPALKQK